MDKDTESFELKFKNDCSALHKSFNAWGNPFEEEEPGLVHLTSKANASRDSKAICLDRT